MMAGVGNLKTKIKFPEVWNLGKINARVTWPEMESTTGFTSSSLKLSE